MVAKKTLLSTQVRDAAVGVDLPVASINRYCETRDKVVTVQVHNTLYSDSPMNPNPVNGKKLRCPFWQTEKDEQQVWCPYTCKTNVDLLRHELGEHSNYAPYLCPYEECATHKGFKQHSALKTHIDSIHLRISHSCVCGKNYTDHSALSRHMHNCKLIKSGLQNGKGSAGDGEPRPAQLQDQLGAVDGFGGLKAVTNYSQRREEAMVDFPELRHVRHFNKRHEGEQCHRSVNINYAFSGQSQHRQSDDMMEEDYHGVPKSYDDLHLEKTYSYAPMEQWGTAQCNEYIWRMDETAGQEFGWDYPASPDALNRRNLMYMAYKEIGMDWTNMDEAAFWHREYHGELCLHERCGYWAPL
jgi:hypothetical protein